MRPTGTDPGSSKASIHKVLQNKRDIIHKTNEDQRISDSIEELLLQFDPQIQYRCYTVIKREEDQPRNFIKIHCNMTGMKDVSSFDEQTFFKLLRKLKYLFSITINGLPLTYLPSDLLEKIKHYASKMNFDVPYDINQWKKYRDLEKLSLIGNLPTFDKFIGNMKKTKKKKMAKVFENQITDKEEVIKKLDNGFKTEAFIALPKEVYIYIYHQNYIT